MEKNYYRKKLQENQKKYNKYKIWKQLKCCQYCWLIIFIKYYKREKSSLWRHNVPARISPWTWSTFFLSFLVTVFELWKELVPAISSTSSSRIISSGRSLEKSSISISLLGGLMLGSWLRHLRKSKTCKKHKHFFFLNSNKFYKKQTSCFNFTYLKRVRNTSFFFDF